MKIFYRLVAKVVIKTVFICNIINVLFVLGFLYDALKMYTVKSIRNEIERPYYYYNRRNSANNRVNKYYSF